MKYITTITFFLLSYTQTYAQVPINYIVGKNSISKDYILSGKSQLKIKNTSKIESLIKANLDFTDFCKKNKDSIGTGYISSLLLFYIKDRSVIMPNVIQSDFELDNIANNCINTFFNQIKFCNLTNKQFVLGFYLTFLPNEDKFTFGFVQVINNEYYSIYAGSELLHLKQNKQRPQHAVIKPD